MSAIPLPDIKAHLNITHARDDAELQKTLNAAEGWVSKFLGGPIGVGARSFKVHANGRNLVLPATRLASVVSVVDPDGNVVTFDADDDVNLLSGIVAVPYRRAGAWTVEATFPATVPDDIRFAVLVIAQHLWETQRVPGQGEGARPGFGGAGGASGQSAGYAIPNRAKTLLEPYRQVPVA